MHSLKLIRALQLVAFEYTAVSLAGAKDVENTQCYILTNDICLPDTYNKYQPPKTQIEVEIGMRIEQVTKVNDADATVDLVAYTTYSWEEGRLIHSDVTENKTVLNIGWLDELWLPNIYFYRMKLLKMPKTLQPNTGTNKAFLNFFIDANHSTFSNIGVTFTNKNSADATTPD